MLAGAALQLVGDRAVSYKSFEDYCGVTADDFPLTEVFEGGTIEGNLCWSVPSDEVGTLVMYSQDIVGFDRDKRVYYALD